MAKIVVQHSADPGIAVILEEVTDENRKPGYFRAKGVHGACTECGRVTHHWHRDSGITAAQEHVDRHESGL